MKRRLLLTLVASALAVFLGASAPAQAQGTFGCPPAFSPVFAAGVPIFEAKDRNGDGIVCLKRTPGARDVLILIDNHT